MKTYNDRQNEIMETAISLIASSGIQECTIRNISEKIGLTEPAIYRHFKNKQDLLIQILKNFRNQVELLFSSSLYDNKTTPEKIQTFFENISQIFIEKPAIASVIFSEEMFRNDRRLSSEVYKTMLRTMDFFQNLITEGRKNNSISSDLKNDQLSLFILGAFRLLITQWRLSDFNFDLKKEISKFTDSVKIILNSGPEIEEEK